MLEKGRKRQYRHYDHSCTLDTFTVINKSMFSKLNEKGTRSRVEEHKMQLR